MQTLEKSGNKAVNAMYTSALEGNHTDKHIGALASAAFVESKYKECLYFSEDAYNEQMQLRAMLQFAKDGVPTEAEPVEPTTEDLVRKALNRKKEGNKGTDQDEDNSIRRGSHRRTPRRAISLDADADYADDNRPPARGSQKIGIRRASTVDMGSGPAGERRAGRRQSRRLTNLGGRGEHAPAPSKRVSRTMSGDSGRRISKGNDRLKRGIVKPEGSLRRSSTTTGDVRDGGCRRPSTTVGAPRQRGSRSPGPSAGRVKRASDRSPAPGPRRNSEQQRNPDRARSSSDRELPRTSDHEFRRTSDHGKKKKIRSPRVHCNVRRLSREPPLLGKTLDDDDSYDDDDDDDDITLTEPKPAKKRVSNPSPGLIAGVRKLGAKAPLLGKSLADSDNDSDTSDHKLDAKTKLLSLYQEGQTLRRNNTCDEIDDDSSSESSSFSASSEIDLSVSSSSLPSSESNHSQDETEDENNEKESATDAQKRRQMVFDILHKTETPTKGDSSKSLASLVGK